MEGNKIRRKVKNRFITQIHKLSSPKMELKQIFDLGFLGVGLKDPSAMQSVRFYLYKAKNFEPKAYLFSKVSLG